jgi:hypothetical protein
VVQLLQQRHDVGSAKLMQQLRHKTKLDDRN